MHTTQGDRTQFLRAFADVIQRVHKVCKNKHVVNRAIILFIQNPHYLRFSLYYWSQCINGFILLLKKIC